MITRFHDAFASGLVDSRPVALLSDFVVSSAVSLGQSLWGFSQLLSTQRQTILI